MDRRRLLQATGLAALMGCWRRSGPAEPEPPARLALLVGVTTYASGTPWRPLAGPANDVELWAQVLRDRHGFPEEGITRLTESETKPTRAAIVSAFKRLASAARPGGQVFILLSGHGTQQPDQMPPDPEDPEPNGMDQVFLPADAGGPNRTTKTIPNGIIDDEIRIWLRAIAKTGARVWMVCDCCHSGTMLRGEEEDGVRGVPAARVWPAEVIAMAKQQGVAPLRGAAPSPIKLQAEKGIVAFYACGPEERTWDAFFSDTNGDRKLGIFSQALCGLMARSTEKLTYRSLIAGVPALYQGGTAARMRPVPFAEGDSLDLPLLLGDAEPARTSFDLVRTDKGWLLRGGELHGLYPGAVLAVDGGYGHGRVVRSGPLSSLVEPVAYADLPKREDWPQPVTARPVFLVAPSRRIDVYVGDQSGRDVLVAAAQRVRGVRVVKQPTLEAWRVADGVLTASGLAPRLAVPEARALEEHLRWIARSSAMLALASTPGPNLGLRLEVLKRRAGKWEAMKSGEKARAGDQLRARVANDGTKAADVTLLYVDHNYLIATFIPDPNAKAWVTNRVQPGKELFSDLINVQAVPHPEVDRLVMVAVEAKGEKPTEFSCLAQPTYALARGARSALEELLAGTAFGEGGVRGIAAEHRHQLAAVSWVSEP